jgi:hypothetical protein
MGKRRNPIRNISGFYGRGIALVFDDDVAFQVENAVVNISSVGKVGRKRHLNYGIAVFTGYGASRKAIKDALSCVLKRLKD